MSTSLKTDPHFDRRPHLNPSHNQRCPGPISLSTARVRTGREGILAAVAVARPAYGLLLLAPTCTAPAGPRHARGGVVGVDESQEGLDITPFLIVVLIIRLS